MNKVEFKVEDRDGDSKPAPSFVIYIDGREVIRAFLRDADAVAIGVALKALVVPNDRIKELEEKLDWVRQTVHRAYHYATRNVSFGALDYETPMETCPKDLCISIRRVLGMEG